MTVYYPVCELRRPQDFYNPMHEYEEDLVAIQNSIVSLAGGLPWLARDQARHCAGAPPCTRACSSKGWCRLSLSRLVRPVHITHEQLPHFSLGSTSSMAPGTRPAVRIRMLTMSLHLIQQYPGIFASLKNIQ